MTELLTFKHYIHMKNTFFTAIVAVAAVVGGVAMSAPAAEAACSYNGYLNSNGTCAVSWQNQPNWQYQNQYQYQFTNSYSTEYLQNYIRQLQTLLAQLQAMQQGGGYYNPGTGTGTSDVDVTTKSVTDIDGDEATLRGEIDFNNEDEAVVYFRWGTSVNNLSRETTNIVIEEDEDDEEFSARITNLDEDEVYYFRAVAEDENGDRDYGAILSFRSDDDGDDDDDSYEDMPEVDDLDANDITDSSVELEGSVDMNDFEDGYVFFVYGEDEDQVDDIANDYDTYADVDNDGDDLQKIAVDSSLDNDSSYWASISGLDEDTEIFYTLCVAFEDEDNDDVIVCGDTESFTTDED